MSTLLICAAAVCCAILVVAGANYAMGMSLILRLFDQPLQWGDELPLVSLIVPARNEERNIEEGIRSLLSLNYPRLEITIVNDRSTDQTGAIIDRLAATQPRLNVVTVDELPAGWLGKNHAMQLGADRSHGEWFLFTDADVTFDCLTLRRAIPYVLKNRVDHLVLTPQTIMPNWRLQAMVCGFAFFFNFYLRPWRVNDPQSRAHIGIGAFNLVRATCYRAVGGHTALAMRPDDDLKLGKIIKQHRFIQHLLSGNRLVRVEWYASLREMIVGLEKNTFAVVDYQAILIFASTSLVFAMIIWPFLALLLVSGLAWWLNLVCCFLLLGMAARTAASMEYPLTCAIAIPVAALLMIYIQWRSTWLALQNRGIRWRDTLYSLEELRANRI